MAEDTFIPTDPDVQPASLGDVTADPSRNLAFQDEDTDSAFRKACKSRFDRYQSEREDWDTLAETSDYAYKAGQNRTINATEKAVGAVLADNDDTQAQTGSTLFFRQTRQQASQYYAVHKSKPAPLSYEPIVNRDIFESSMEGREQATMHNMMFRWVQKQDDADVKTQDFAETIYKVGHACEVVYMKRRVGTRTVRVPKYNYSLSETQELVQEFAGYEERTEEFIVENHPSFMLVPHHNVYADVNLPWGKQDCVQFVDPVSYSEIIGLARVGEYNIEAITDEDTGLQEKHLWDGVIGGEHKETEQTSAGLDGTTPPVETGQFLRWNIFFRVPIDESGKWDEEKTVPELYWGTFIGNSIDEAVLVRLERNPDPDDEIPAIMVNAYPGESDQLYHLSPFQIIRSNYSVECTLMNQAIDNTTRRNNPVILEKTGRHRVKDFTIQKNAVWSIDEDGAITSFEIPDTTANTLGLLQHIQGDTQRALATDTNLMGESFGARTSAEEASNIFQSSQQPNFAIIRYIMAQRAPWYGKKVKSYIQKYGEPEQIAAITDSNGDLYEFELGQLYGEFNIEINLVDEYQDSAMRLQALNNFMQTIGASEVMAAKVDIGELVRMMAEEMKLPTARLILPNQDYDARSKAQEENTAMRTGTPVEVFPEQNHAIHIQSHKAERLRFIGVEDQFPQVQLLDQHIAEHEAALQSGRAGPGGQGGPGTAPPPTGQQNESGGEVAGNAIAEARGGPVVAG